MNGTAHRWPSELIDVWTLGDGRRLTVRPVLPQDAPLQRALVRGLSAEARYQRFLAPIAELPAAWAERMTQPDFRNHVALIAETFAGGTAIPVAEARYVVDEVDAGAEFALVVADGWRRQGVARRLLGALLHHACRHDVPAMWGETLPDNQAMIGLARSLGFRLRVHPQDARLVLLERRLEAGRCADFRPPIDAARSRAAASAY